MKFYLTLAVAFVFGVSISSCTRHTTCAAYGATIQKVDKSQDEVHAVVAEENVTERI